MTFRLLGLPEELRLQIEEASEGAIKTEAARLIIETSVQQALGVVETAMNNVTREVQGVIGPHGSVTRLQAGGINITRGEGISVYADGVAKTTITPRGDVFIGSDVTRPATTTEIFFVEEAAHNGESFGAGDFLIGNNSSGESNIKWDASEGQLQFRGGTTVKAYMDTDGSIKAGGGDVILDEFGITFKNEEGNVTFETSSGSLDEVLIYIDGDDNLTVKNAVGGKSIVFDIDDVSHNVKTIDFTGSGNISVNHGYVDIAAGNTYKVNGVAVPLYLPFGVYLTVNPITAAASPGIPYLASVSSAKTLTLVSWGQAWFVDTTNSGTHYWTVELKDIDGNVIASFNTSAGAASTWTLQNVTSFNQATLTSADKAVALWVTKTGTPGSIYVAGPALEVRL